MITAEEVITFYTDLKKKVNAIKDPEARHKFIIEQLGHYSLSQWCEVGDILIAANLIQK